MACGYVKNRRRNTKNPLITLGILVIAVALIAGVLFYIRSASYRELSSEEISYAIIRAEETGETEQRMALAKTAVSLVGKVNYFWGGKSNAIGFDEQWGTPTLVTSEGSQTSGTMRPYGLDCSGFIAWCFIQQGYTPADVEKLVGIGSWHQWERSSAIHWQDLRVGDFAYLRAYPTNKGNHIGIVIGFTEGGRPLIAHCSSGFNNVVVTTAGNVFKLARTPNILGE